MNALNEIKTVLGEKRGKKLAALYVGVFLLIVAVVFFATFKLCENIHLKQMNNYLADFRRMIESSESELHARSRIYEQDILTRAALGVKICAEKSAPAEGDELERIREAVSASSVSLLDGQRQLISSTGPKCPEEIFFDCLKNLETGKAYTEIYPATDADGKNTEKTDGRGFVMLPVSSDSDRTLVFEFECGHVLAVYNAIDEWSAMLDQFLSSGELAAYARTGDQVESELLDNLTPEETAQIREELMKVFGNSTLFNVRGDTSSARIITLLTRHYLAAMMNYPDKNTDILLTMPLIIVLRNGIFIATAISAMIGLGMVLIVLYVFRRRQRETDITNTAPVTLGWVWKAIRPGILVLFAVIFVFSSMLLLLENRSNAAYFAVSNRESLQNEIDLRKEQENTIRATFMDCYRARTQTLASFLRAHPDDRTNAGLADLSRIAGSEYLMLFDMNGQETVSSNSYVAFTVEKNLNEELGSVLMGYPYAVTGPEKDPYTGQSQITAAALMTDLEGRPDGFLLAVFSAGDLTAELQRMRMENTVNHFGVLQGQIAALIDDGSGRFIAHTDPKMIGQKAENHLENVELGSDFEGFTTCDQDHVYISASNKDGKTLLFIAPDRGDAYTRTVSVLMVLAVFLILVFLYCPFAGILSARAADHARDGLQDDAAIQRSPLRVFYNGYVLFLTLFTLFAVVASSQGWWTSFDYVFNRQWSKGLHLFSIWGALFVLSLTLCFLFLVRAVLHCVEKRLPLRSRTITRIAGSFISYSAVFFLVFCILDMFGVNTATLLASAGIISIAVGMGAQSMAADLLAGFFLMVEGTVHVGDHVTIGSVKGTITDIGIRTTEVTDEKGNVVIFNNSKVTGVSNMSKKSGQKTENAPNVVIHSDGPAPDADDRGSKPAQQGEKAPRIES